MNLMPFFKEYMKNYEGLDDYLSLPNRPQNLPIR